MNEESDVLVGEALGSLGHFGTHEELDPGVCRVDVLVARDDLRLRGARGGEPEKPKQ